MRPLRPDERAEILAAHPEATEADLDEFEALVARRFQVPEPPADQPPEERQRLLATELHPAHVRDIDADLVEFERTRFPRLQEALARANRRPDEEGSV
jgi:hypothetical protein